MFLPHVKPTRWIWILPSKQPTGGCFSGITNKGRSRLQIVWPHDARCGNPGLPETQSCKKPPQNITPTRAPGGRGRQTDKNHPACGGNLGLPKTHPCRKITTNASHPGEHTGGRGRRPSRQTASWPPDFTTRTVATLARQMLIPSSNKQHTKWAPRDHW